MFKKKEKKEKKPTLKDKKLLEKKKASEKNDEEVQEQKQETISDRLKKQKAVKPKKERFEVVKMWVYYIGSMIAKDRGTIPSNIGNKILITSNMYITKLYLSSIIQITQAGLNVPITTVQELTRYLRDKKCGAVVDATFKRQRMDLSINDSGLTSRKRTWKNTMDKDYITDKQKEISARCLYTTDLLESGEQLCYTRVYITLRAKTGSELKRAETLAGQFFAQSSIVYLPITSNVKDTLEFMSILSDKYSREVKDAKALVTSDLTLAQMLPNTGAYNGNKGLWFGVNIENNSHYNVDFESITIARNIYLIAPSGVGKTVMSNNIISSALEKPNWRACAMDIKGNELSNLCLSVNGLILDLTPKSREYINSFKMVADYVDYEEAQEYFKDNFNLSKETMLILSDLTGTEEVNQANALVDRFLNNVYNNMGVMPDNKNTWYRTNDLNAYVIYDLFVDYMTASMLAEYNLCGKKMVDNLKPYMYRQGSKSYVFLKEFDMTRVYSAKMVVFNFGMLLYGTETSRIDAPLFRLKFSYSQRINGAYISYNYNNKFETFKVLEESQIAPNDVLKKYVEEFTLRRAQRQTTLLIGNSIQALLDNDISKPLIENTRALLIGDLPKDAREEVINQFDLRYLEDMIMKVGTTEEYYNSFVFVNRMQPEPLVPIIKLILDENKAKTGYYKQFRPAETFNH